MASRIAQNCMFPAPKASEIKEAVRAIILAVKRDKHLTNAQLAAIIDESPATLGRLEDMKTDKPPASFISAIAAHFGGEYIQSYMALFGHKAVPGPNEEAVNALPALAALVAKLAASLADGRAEISHMVLASILPELRAVDGVVSQLRSRASDMGMVA